MPSVIDRASGRKQGVAERLARKLRMAPGTWKCPHVHQRADLRFLENRNELDSAARAVADRADHYLRGFGRLLVLGLLVGLAFGLLLGLLLFLFRLASFLGLLDAVHQRDQRERGVVALAKAGLEDA